MAASVPAPALIVIDLQKAIDHPNGASLDGEYCTVVRTSDVLAAL